MPDPGPTATEAAPARHDFVLPPRHRLFAVFDGNVEAASAVAALRSAGHAGEDDVRVLAGAEGIATIDASGAVHGAWGRVVRMAEEVLAEHDVEYLEVLEEELRAGHVVVVVRVADETEADEVARDLRDRSGHTFAYGAHWDFVPVVS